MGNMITRVNGIAVKVTTTNDEFVAHVDTSDPAKPAMGQDAIWCYYSTENVRGNYSKVIALNEAMREVMARTTNIANTDFPF
jgi:hypothetical protein